MGAIGSLGLLATSMSAAQAAPSGAAPGAGLNGSGATFESAISVSGNDVTVSVEAFGVTPSLPHAQHIHIPAANAAICPTAANDANSDGVVDTAEGVSSYGSVNVSLTTTGDATASSALAVDRFPTADADGRYSYSRTITVAPEIAARITSGAIVVHGIDLDTSGSYDGAATSSLDPSLPLEATVPAACGAIKASSYEASVTGTSLNSSGTTFDGTVQVHGSTATVALAVSGAADELPHAQHIHLTLGQRSTCPSVADDDTNSDGLLQTTEGVPRYGGIQASLTTAGDTSPDSALAVDRFPVADGSGAYTYVRTFPLSAELIDEIGNGAVVVHGVDVNSNGSYDGVPSTLDASIPQEATLPAACGQITARSFTASAVGNSLNSSGGWFDSVVTLDGTELSVQIHAYGMTPNLPHAQHIHLALGTKSTCPTEANDTNSDGVVDTAEGVPAYGSVQVSLTTEGDSTPDSALAVDRFPVADAGGEYVYERTFTLGTELAANVTNAAVVLHGIDRNANGSYDGDAPSSLDPSLPLEATIPAACGTVSLDNHFTAAKPARVLDTRGAIGVPGTSPVTAGGVVEVQVAGEGGVPSDGIVAVALNVTATQASQGTYVTAWPTGSAKPGTSNLNVTAGVDVPNQVIVALGADGKVSLANEFGTVHLIADVAGYFPDGSPMVPVAPTRVVDTRNGIGTPTAKLGADSSLDVQVTGLAGVPTSGVDSVIVNITGTNATAPTWMTAWPTGEPQPNASTLNLTPGVDRPNSAVVKVGADGMISLYNFTGTTDVIVDIFGYIESGASFTGLNPARVLDTRNAIGAPTAKVGPDSMVNVDVTGVGGVPAAGVDSVVVALTATNATEPSWATAWPSGTQRPYASSLNYMPGVDVVNTLMVKVGADGTIDLYNFTGSTDLIVDVVGYFPR